jgi:hypothetical protein
VSLLTEPKVLFKVTNTRDMRQRTVVVPRYIISDPAEAALLKEDICSYIVDTVVVFGEDEFIVTLSYGNAWIEDNHAAAAHVQSAVNRVHERLLKSERFEDITVS